MRVSNGVLHMLNINKWSPFFNQRLLFMLAFGFSSGLPFALTGSTLQAWLSQAHTSLIAMGIFSLVSLPYSCKFLWAPLLDRFIFLQWGRRRGWILLTQLCLAIALFSLAEMHPQSHIQMIAWLALLITFFSATQDIAIDAYRADSLFPPERGLGSAYFIFAYRIALFVSGGLALVMASYLGWQHTYQVMGGLMLFGMWITYIAPEKPLDVSPTQQQSNLLFFITPFQDLWRRDNIILIAIFLILYKAGAALSVALLTHFLLHGLGFSLIEIGVASKVVIIVGTILGGLVGGAILWHLGVYRSLLWFGLAQAVSILSFMLLAVVGKVFSVMILSLFIENFCSGMSSAALMAFIMSLCNVRYSATQFAFFSAIDSLARMFSGPLAAVLVLHWGWVSFYGWAFILSLPALFLLIFLRERVFVHAEALSYS